MPKELIIQITKATLVLYESELLKALPVDLLEKAIKRGKYYKRALAIEKREMGGINK